MGALMTRDDVAAVFAAALERRSRERRFTREWTEAERRQAWVDDVELPERRLYDPEFRSAESSNDFWDDRILERNSSWHGNPETPALTALAVAARDAGDAAAAVELAGQLDPAVQWVVFQQLGLWRKHEDAVRLGAGRLVDQMLAEWERLGLQTEDPGKPRPERRKRRWEIETEAAHDGAAGRGPVGAAAGVSGWPVPPRAHGGHR